MRLEQVNYVIAITITSNSRFWSWDFRRGAVSASSAGGSAVTAFYVDRELCRTVGTPTDLSGTGLNRVITVREARLLVVLHSMADHMDARLGF
jgi:hypothetical protein